MISDYYFVKRGKHLANLHILSAFADYKVPQLLRHLGILNYSPELSRLVDAQQLIAKDSAYENQIRIATILAVEDIEHELESSGRQLLACQIDGILWNRAAQNNDKMLPYHRTYTAAY